MSATVTNVDGHDVGKLGYEAYASSTGGKTFDGRDMPTWEDLPERIQRAWYAAASAIIMIPTLSLRDRAGP